MNSAQVCNWGSGWNVPYDVDEGINVLEVKNEVVVHRVDRECQVESVEDPVQLFGFVSITQAERGSTNHSRPT